MADPTLPPTGATPFELLDLERRISERGLQLRKVPTHTVKGDLWYGRKAERIGDYEETLIRTALLAMAERPVP
jgi:hypothetical protein